MEIQLVLDISEHYYTVSCYSYRVPAGDPARRGSPGETDRVRHPRVPQLVLCPNRNSGLHTSVMSYQNQPQLPAVLVMPQTSGLKLRNGR